MPEQTACDCGCGRGSNGGDLDEEVERAVAERVEAGELVTRAAHEDIVADFERRLRRAEERFDRVLEANERFMRQYAAAQARIRQLEERIRDLQATTSGDDDGAT